MKVTLENFGPIRKAEFDLSKDMNVIFGKNNIGKSYAITALYILLKHLISGFGTEWRYSDAIYQAIIHGPEFKSRQQESSKPFEEIIKEARNAFRQDSKLNEYELSSSLGYLLKEVFSSSIFEQLGASFNNSFQSVKQLANQRVNEQLQITIETAQFTLLFRVKGDELTLDEVQFTHPVFARKIKTNRTPSITERQTTLYFKVGGRETKERPYDGDRTSIVNTLFMLVGSFRNELLAIADSIYFLPASRSGLYQALSAFGAVIAELSKSRHFVTSNFSLPNISEPVADYFLKLSNINPSDSKGDIYNIAQEIESEILGGEVGFSQQTKKLYFSQTQLEQEMDLSFTSSMISEIAPIVAYLKYVLSREPELYYNRLHRRGLLLEEGNAAVHPTPYSLIFIEEPEAHLHPEVQVKLMKFFGRLTKHNVKVVMTSHSNYMFNKLSNLLLTNELEPEKVGSYLMRATPEGSVMDPAAMRAEEEGIADENFVDVAEQLYNERLRAYDKTGA